MRSEEWPAWFPLVFYTPSTRILSRRSSRPSTNSFFSAACRVFSGKRSCAALPEKDTENFRGAWAGWIFRLAFPAPLPRPLGRSLLCIAPAAAYHRLPDLTPDGHARDAHVDAGAEQEVDPRLLRRRELVARSLHLRCRDTPRPSHPGSRFSQTTIYTCIFHLYKPLIYFIYIIYINHIADANAGA